MAYTSSEKQYDGTGNALGHVGGIASEGSGATRILCRSQKSGEFGLRYNLWSTKLRYEGELVMCQKLQGLILILNRKA